MENESTSKQVKCRIRRHCDILQLVLIFFIFSKESKEDISEFADDLASCLLKETIQEVGASGEQEGEWAIPCSSVCHQRNHDKGLLLSYYLFCVMKTYPFQRLSPLVPVSSPCRVSCAGLRRVGQASRPAPRRAATWRGGRGW